MRRYWKRMENLVNARLALYMGMAAQRHCNEDENGFNKIRVSLSIPSTETGVWQSIAGLDECPFQSGILVEL